MKYFSLETKFGWLAAAWRGKQVTALVLPRKSKAAAVDELSKIVHIFLNKGRYPEFEQQLQAYFAGKRKQFTLPTDLGWATPFQQRVYSVAKEIPFGEVRSYGWVAAKIGIIRASRAVGQALGKNRIPLLIPCHRVVRSDGSLGGFSGGTGLKQKLLQLEKQG